MYSCIRKHAGSCPGVLIGILSSRNNFIQRDSIRKGWGSSAKENDHLDLKFFIGNACYISPEYRSSDLECEEWNEGLIAEEIWQAVDLNKSFNEIESRSTDINYLGFGFRVLHSTILHSLGVNCQLLELSKDDVFYLNLKDAEETFVKLKLNATFCTDCKLGYCFVKLAQTYLLPKGFEGEIFLEGDGFNPPSMISSHSRKCSWMNGSVIDFTFVRYNSHVFKWKDNHCSVINAQFKIEDKASLIEHFSSKKERNDEWRNMIVESETHLSEELERYGDIVRLPMVDVYRNLPSKLKHLIKWVSDKNLDFVLKVDDDSYVNIKKVMASLPRVATVPTLWSQLHYDFSVAKFGKWADYDYQSIVYPPFPSGAGYLMSGSLVTLLSNSSSWLKEFQGEDVSMGIWTETICAKRYIDDECIGVSKVDVPCWLPGDDCVESFLVSQLTPKQMLGDEFG